MTRVAAGLTERTEFRPLAGQMVPVTIRHNPRARRLAVKIDPDHDALDVVVPRGVSQTDVQQFLDTHADWALGELSKLPPRVAFTDGSLVPILGVSYRLCHLPLLPRGVRADGHELVVGGFSPDLRRPVTAWLRALAKSELAARSRTMAELIGRQIKAVSVRDQRTRWGSCTPDGRLSFSWRLVLAPVEVLDYVVAHEVAHLQELNHGPHFWQLVDQICPNNQPARRWLRDNPFVLRRYG